MRKCKVLMSVLVSNYVAWAAFSGDIVTSASGGWFASDSRAVKSTTWEGGLIVGGQTNLVLQSSPTAWGEVGGGQHATIIWESTSGDNGIVITATTADLVLWIPETHSGTYTLTYISGSVVKTAHILVASLQPDAPFDPIPYIGDTPSAADVAATVASAADPQIVSKIDVMNYNDFRNWAGKVKTKGGNDAGAQGVMNADTAWFSYALGQDTLLETAPTDADLTIEAFAPTDEAGKFNFTMSVGTIQVGSASAKENLKKVFGLEGAATLDNAAFSPNKVDIEFGTPVDGKVKFTAGPNSENANGKAFFMKIKMLP